MPPHLATFLVEVKSIIPVWTVQTVYEHITYTAHVKNIHVQGCRVAVPNTTETVCRCKDCSMQAQQGIQETMILI